MKKTFFEKVEAQVVEAGSDYLNRKIKKKLFRLGEVSMFIFLSFVLISIGLAFLIGKYFPLVDSGLNFIILGIIFLLVGVLLNK